MKKSALVFMIIFPLLVSAREWIPANHPYVQYIGRWDFSDSTRVRHSWPGVYLIFRFMGDSIWVRMEDDVNYYNVEIDGKFYCVFHGDQSGEADYLLAKGLDQGPHTVRLSKRNIAFGRVFSISGFWLSEGGKILEPPPRPKWKIEFLGDSYTCAEGNEATELEMEWTAKMPVTNIDQGFPAMVARHFDAEYHITARSGIGLVCDWQGNRDIALPKWFDRTLMESEEPKWDFSRFIPNLVVICLGLNDYSGFGGWKGQISNENRELFQSAYHGLLATLRRVYPGVKILAVAPHVAWIQKQVKTVVEREKANGKADIGYCQFNYVKDGYVANGHPTVSTHRIIAERVIQIIEEMGWLEDGKKINKMKAE